MLIIPGYIIALGALGIGIAAFIAGYFTGDHDGAEAEEYRWKTGKKTVTPNGVIHGRRKKEQ